MMQLGPMVEKRGAQRRQLVGGSTLTFVAFEGPPDQLALLAR